MKLFIVNAPYWYWTMRPRGMKTGETAPPQSMDPLDEHHTYLYYQFLKFGLVDEVIIYSDRYKHDSEQQVPDEFSFPEGKMRVVYDSEYRQLADCSDQLLYSRDNLEKSPLFPQHIQIVKCIAEGFPVYDAMRWLPGYVPGICRPNQVKSGLHSLLLAEGPYNRRFIPKGVPSLDWPTLSNQQQYVKALPKRYDWIMIASFNPRKQLVEFCQQMLAQGMTNLKGCILVASPKSKSTQEEMQRLEDSGLLSKLNIDLKLDLDCRSKMEALCESRVFVCCSREDSGPRSLIEAGQADIPIVALHHHGSASLLVKPGVNGEMSWRFKKLPVLLKKILDRYEDYDCSINKDLLDEGRWFIPIREKIQHLIESRREK